jgi:hypothetical protein
VAWTEVQVMRVSVQSDGVKLNLPSRKVLSWLQSMFPDAVATAVAPAPTLAEPVKSLAVVHMLTLVEEEVLETVATEAAAMEKRKAIFMDACINNVAIRDREA